MKSLRDVRKELNMTLRQLSEKTGISISHLSEIENGKFKANRATREKIENIVGKCDWLESETIQMQIANFYKAERLLKKLVTLSLTMCSCDRETFTDLVRKYF